MPDLFDVSINHPKYKRNNLPVEDALGAPRPQLTMSEAPVITEGYHKPLCLRHSRYVCIV